MVVEVTRQPSVTPKVAVYAGTKLATSTLLSHRVVGDARRRRRGRALPDHTRDWLALQAEVSRLPRPGRLLAETFRAAGREHLCLYGFAGRNAHQTLGLLVTRRMEAAGLHPLGFVATDYALLIWGLEEVRDPAALLTPEGLREGLEGWLGENAVMKRTFRDVATIAGLIEQNMPGLRKTGRQATFSSDILYDTLRRYDPGHLLLRITREEAGRGLVDFGRIEEMLARSRGRIDVVRGAARDAAVGAALPGDRAGPDPRRGRGAAGAGGGGGAARRGGAGAVAPGSRGRAGRVTADRSRTALRRRRRRHRPLRLIAVCSHPATRIFAAPRLSKPLRARSGTCRSRSSSRSEGRASTTSSRSTWSSRPARSS